MFVVLLVSMAATPSAQAPPAEGVQEIERLVARLEPYGDRSVAWSATSRLQKLGAPAVAALVSGLRHDTYRDDHGNHSPMMEALEKIGPPAAMALDVALTPAVLESTSPDDINFVTRSTSALARIGVDQTARTLIRIARDSADPETRIAAAGSLLGPWPPRDPVVSIGESCLGRHWSACPFDAEAAGVAAAVSPLLPEVVDMLPAASTPRARLAIAPVLVRWGEGVLQRRGEQELVALVSSDDPYVAQQAMEFLGALGVDTARTVIRSRAASPATDALRRTAAAALERLNDPAYVPLTIALMTSEDPLARQWSMESARRSQNVALVPALIDRLDDRFPNGRTRLVRSSDGRASTEPVTAGDDALAALRALTFQEFGPDQAVWREWWAANHQVPWSEHLTRFIDTRMTQIIRAEPWTMNAWMTQLMDARHPASISFIRAYLRHPRTDPGSVGPNASRGGGGPPAVLTLLMELVAQGNVEARQLLYECLGSETWLVLECPRHVAAFDPPRAASQLAALVSGERPTALQRRYLPAGAEAIRFQAAETLLALGDARAIPVLIENLQPSVGVVEVDPLTAWAANRLLRFYTQEDISLDSDAPPETRRNAHAAWRRWWQETGGTFVVNVRAARIDLECCRV